MYLFQPRTLDVVRLVVMYLFQPRTLDVVRLVVHVSVSVKDTWCCKASHHVSVSAKDTWCCKASRHVSVSVKDTWCCTVSCHNMYLCQPITLHFVNYIKLNITLWISSSQAVLEMNVITPSTTNSDSVLNSGYIHILTNIFDLHRAQSIIPHSVLAGSLKFQTILLFSDNLWLIICDFPI